MRIELSRIRDIDRRTAIAVVVLLVGVGVSAWLVGEVLKGERAVETLEEEVAGSQAITRGLPESPEPMNPEQLELQLTKLVAPAGREEELREQLALAAVEHKVDVKRMDYSSAVVDPASTAEDDVLLRSLGISDFTSVTIEFNGDYQNAARFLDALERLPQPASIRTAELRRDPPRVGGTVVLHVYRKGS